MKLQRRHNAGQQSGFTLVEVAIAIGILAVMGLINYNMLITLVESKVEIDDQRDSVFVANSVLTRLTRELQLVGKDPRLPPSCDNPTNQRQNAVLLGENGGQGGSGNGPSLTFSAKDAGQHIHDGNSHSGAVQITYRVVPDPDKKGDKDAGLLLIRDEIPNRPPFDVACKDSIRFPITNRLVNMELKFFDKKTAEWSDEWNGQRAANLPDIIQFTLWLKSDKGRVSSYTSAVKLSP
jgi:prepilin-type N-terminal cleavage/methylation domain-containing protein